MRHKNRYLIVDRIYYHCRFFGEKHGSEKDSVFQINLIYEICDKYFNEYKSAFEFSNLHNTICLAANFRFMNHRDIKKIITIFSQTYTRECYNDTILASRIYKNEYCE